MHREAIQLYERARSGTAESFWTGAPSIGPEGSAGWRSAGAVEGNGAPRLPVILILSDLKQPFASELEEGTLPAGAFGPEVQHVTHLDLSGNSLKRLPSDTFTRYLAKSLKALFLGGPQGQTSNIFAAAHSIPPLDALVHLEHLSLHDTELKFLPALPQNLKTLRIDRTQISELPSTTAVTTTTTTTAGDGSRTVGVAFAPTLPLGLTTLHLEGCPLPGTLDDVAALPETVLKLSRLEDLQLPCGSHVGIFFGSPLQELLATSTAGGGAKEEADGEEGEECKGNGLV